MFQRWVIRTVFGGWAPPTSAHGIFLRATDQQALGVYNDPETCN